jgi:hypothetical protein
LWSLLLGEAGFENWCFVGRNSTPMAGWLGLQWKVDSKAAPGMWTFPGSFPRCFLENSRHQRIHTRSQLKKPNYCHSNKQCSLFLFK